MELNKYHKEEQQVMSNWHNYLSEIEQRNTQMWNTILYNQFVNEEIRRLNRELYFLRKDVDDEKCKNMKLEDEKQIAEKELDYIKGLHHECKVVKVKVKRKISESEEWLKSEKRRRPKKQVKLQEKEVNEKLMNIFNNLKSIDDIVKFKNDVNRFDLLSNKKYEKLYKLIPSCDEFNSMIGMDKVKDLMFKHISYFLHGLNNKSELNHVVITGEPGVGKTTLAKILAKIYLALGFLSNDIFMEVKRSDLIGEYCGQTAVKTQKVINKVQGGVLFIDEVYSLGNKEKRDVFTKECIDTINQNLTEKGDKFLCIIAGYKDDVENCFFSYNKGLERRFPIKFDLESYDEESLTKILLKFIKEEKWKIDNKLETSLLKLIEKNKDLLKYQAGDLRQIFQLTKENYSIRLMKESITDGIGNQLLVLKDFEYAFEKFEKLRKEKKEELSESAQRMYL